MKKYNLPMRIMHWLSGGLFIFAMILGFLLANTEILKANFSTYINLHKSFGISVFVLVILRIIIRIYSEKPTISASNKLEEYLSTTVHYGLYLCLILIPLTGYICSSFARYGNGFNFFNLFQIPYIFNASKQYSTIFYQAHKITNYIALILVGLHLLGTLKHYIFDKENILKKIV